jgi:nucleoside-diphosphate-sugar epimerase
LKEEMKFLWTKDLRINTVHVSDVVGALIAVAQHRPLSGTVYNLADKSETDQESFNVILRKLFGIETGFQGTIISNLARVSVLFGMCVCV